MNMRYRRLYINIIAASVRPSKGSQSISFPGVCLSGLQVELQFHPWAYAAKVSITEAFLYIVMPSYKYSSGSCVDAG